MTTKAFQPKGEDTIRQEVREDLKGDNEDFNAEEYQESINRITARRLKDEEFKASLHKSKEDKKKKLAELEGAKSAKAEIKTEGITPTDEAYFFAKGHTRTELGLLKQAMTALNADFDSAWKSDLFKALKSTNDAKIRSKGGKLGPAGAGGSPKDKTPQPTTDTEKKFSSYISQRAERNKKSYTLIKPKKN
jgi:hypothetical protein